MIRISCSVKVHAFQLAEQLERHGLLNRFYTIYHQAKNPILARFNSRKDVEQISQAHIATFPWLAVYMRLTKDAFRTNRLFDLRVAHSLQKQADYNTLICWSGMSIRSMRQAKQHGKNVVLERGSSHIGFQIPLLEEEYARWGFTFKRDNRVIDQEVEEYELADYITIPSEFVRMTFLKKGILNEKLFKNNFGSTSYFKPTKPKHTKFTILYVGSLSLRKGLPYLFEALQLLKMDLALYDVWFVGTVQTEIQEMLPRYTKSNWKFFGQVNHYQLPDIISPCSVAVHPSLEEGLSMVIPQLMSCGVPVIATTNTGGADIIKDGSNGFIIPVRNAEAIAEKIVMLYQDGQKLTELQEQAIQFGQQFGTWNNYGDRYADFLQTISK
jgi:glycosyltransferase involved in cell wall biosynthesis